MSRCCHNEVGNRKSEVGCRKSEARARSLSLSEESGKGPRGCGGCQHGGVGPTPVGAGRSFSVRRCTQRGLCPPRSGGGAAGRRWWWAVSKAGLPLTGRGGFGFRLCLMVGRLRGRLRLADLVAFASPCLLGAVPRTGAGRPTAAASPDVAVWLSTVLDGRATSGPASPC
jgi:hypothetical protein